MRLAIDYDKNSDVNVAVMKEKGIYFHILKILYGKQKRRVEDAFLAHAEACANQKVWFDVYNYTYARDQKEVVADMQMIVNIINELEPKVRKYFRGTVWLDMEDPEVHGQLPAVKNQKIIEAAKNEIENNGLEFGVYTGMSFYNEHIADLCQVKKWWIARYYKGSGVRFTVQDVPNNKYKPQNIPSQYLAAWQYTDSLYIENGSRGDGDVVDGSRIYKPF